MSMFSASGDTQRNLNDMCFSIDGLDIVQGMAGKQPRKTAKKLPFSNVNKTLHCTKRATDTFNPPSKFSKTDIWGPKFKTRKTLVHAKKH